MRNSSKRQILRNYIVNNYKEYILICLLFIIGIYIGVLIINNCKQTQITEVNDYIKGFIENFRQVKNINKKELILQSIKNNVILAITLWFAGTTVIGLPIVLIIILYRGIILGYTISSITCTIGIIKGIEFCLSSILLQKIIFIPAILTIGVSSIRLYKSIIKDKRKENIKLSIIRHTSISALMIILLIAASVVENVVSISILKKAIKYF